jgi:hypothetical protein
VDGDENRVGPGHRLSGCARVRTGIVGQTVQLLPAARVAEHNVVSRPRHDRVELTAHQRGAKNPNAHLGSVFGTRKYRDASGRRASAPMFTIEAGSPRGVLLAYRREAARISEAELEAVRLRQKAHARPEGQVNFRDDGRPGPGVARSMFMRKLPLDRPMTNEPRCDSAADREARRGVIGPRRSLSYRSMWSVLSAVSLLSVASAASLLSIGSFASILSIGSSCSCLSIGSDGGFLSIGRARHRRHG